MKFNLIAMLSTLTMLQIDPLTNPILNTTNDKIVHIGISILTGVLVPLLKDWLNAKLLLWKSKKGIKPIEEPTEKKTPLFIGYDR